LRIGAATPGELPGELFEAGLKRHRIKIIKKQKKNIIKKRKK